MAEARATGSGFSALLPPTSDVVRSPGKFCRGAMLDRGFSVLFAADFMPGPEAREDCCYRRHCPLLLLLAADGGAAGVPTLDRFHTVAWSVGIVKPKGFSPLQRLEFSHTGRPCGRCLALLRAKHIIRMG